LLFKWFGSTIRVKTQLGDFDPDIIVSDFEPIGIMLAKLLRKPCAIVFGYDPTAFKKWNPKNPKLQIEAKFSCYACSQTAVI